ncbi:MAG: hypothetical protein C0459_13595 [Chitinophaga sp.]|jgi:small nuclear ribonucleoprotein (snRNP)-like protein|nr:hypothetical protein [Chitinophaga sp.]
MLLVKNTNIGVEHTTSAEIETKLVTMMHMQILFAVVVSFDQQCFIVLNDVGEEHQYRRRKQDNVLDNSLIEYTKRCW